MHKWKPMLTRPLGRPKNRWEDDIINDVKKLKIKNWTSCIQDRIKWKLYVEKVKTFKDWSCRAWRKRRRKEEEEKGGQEGGEEEEVCTRERCTDWIILKFITVFETQVKCSAFRNRGTPISETTQWVSRVVWTKCCQHTGSWRSHTARRQAVVAVRAMKA